jgi:hypothetical protein
MKSRLPDTFILVATSDEDPLDIHEEEFHAGVYQHDSDRYWEASQFADRMIAKGFTVEYKEIEYKERQ